jgi:serine/threonine-protein kinase HipA
MSKNQQRNIEVYAHWIGLSDPTLIGFLYATPSRGKEIFSFEYSHDWLKNYTAQVLDPSLQLFRGAQYAPQGQVPPIYQ